MLTKMKAIEPLFRKVFLHLNWMEEPVELWWTDRMVRAWDRNKLRNLEFTRFQSSPYSVLEFDPDLIQAFEFTDEIRHRESPYIQNSTLFMKFLKKSEMPVPKSPFLGHFDYPISFMGFYDPIKGESKFMDVSNYLNLEVLKEQGVLAEDAFMNNELWDLRNFSIENLMFIEYSMM